MLCCSFESAPSTVSPLHLSEVAVSCHIGWAILPLPKKWVSSCASLAWARSLLWVWLKPVYTHSWGKAAGNYSSLCFASLAPSGIFEELPASSEEVFGLLVVTNSINNTRSSEIPGLLQACKWFAADYVTVQGVVEDHATEPWIHLTQCRPNFQLFHIKDLPLLAVLDLLLKDCNCCQNLGLCLVIVLSIFLPLPLQTFHQAIESWLPGTREETGWKTGFCYCFGLLFYLFFSGGSWLNVSGAQSPLVFYYSSTPLLHIQKGR